MKRSDGPPSVPPPVSVWGSSQSSSAFLLLLCGLYSKKETPELPSSSPTIPPLMISVGHKMRPDARERSPRCWRLRGGRGRQSESC